MRLGDKLERGIFTTLVEIFPPNFNAQASKEPLLGLREKTRDIIARVKKVENLADCILVADMKDLGRLKLTSVYTAFMLKQELGAEVIPVITARDMNRSALRALFLSCLSLDLESVMLVWGDRYIGGEGSKNVYDFSSLSDIIGEMRVLATRSNHDATLLAPVDVGALTTQKGAKIAASRVENGADFLLAQPPTSDVTETLPEHVKQVRAHRLDKRVLLNAFPFRSKADIDSCRAKFGWKIPTVVDKLAAEGEARLLKESRLVVDKLRESRMPGVYVSTRGRPELARFILE